jgi:predicted ArsR family transcriptional regulator
MDVPRPTGGPLAQPTRAAIFELLVEMKGGADTAQLAGRLDLHPNGVRRHLERMEDAGLVERTAARGGTGRPPDRWAVCAGANPGGDRPSGYAELAAWLARVIPAGPRREREVEKAGRQIGAELAPQGTNDPLRDLREITIALGFQPDLEVPAAGELKCCLGNCPYRDAVRADQELICTLHRGITAGLLAELDPTATLERFEPKDPERAGCLIGVAGGSWPGPEKDG